MEQTRCDICNTSKLENYTIESESLNLSDKFIPMPRPEARAVPIVLATVFVVGIMGNVTLLYYILRKKLFNSPHSIYVINLAVGDLLMVTIAMPFVSVIYTLDEWPFGEAICKLSEMVHTLSVALTICTITALSIERYFMGRRTDTSTRLRRAKFIILLIWVASLVICVPDLASSTVVEFPNGIKACVTYREDWGKIYEQSFTMIKLLFLFIFPLIIISLFYILVILDLTRNTTEYEQPSTLEKMSMTNAEPRIQNVVDVNKKRKLTIIISCLIVIFVVCWAPRHIYLMWYYFGTGYYNLVWHVLKITGFCLMYVNSALNPYVFLMLDTRFRRFAINCYMCRTDRSDSGGDIQEVQAPQQTIILADFISNEKSNAV